LNNNYLSYFFIAEFIVMVFIEVVEWTFRVGG